MSSRTHERAEVSQLHAEVRPPARPPLRLPGCDRPRRVGTAVRFASAAERARAVEARGDRARGAAAGRSAQVLRSRARARTHRHARTRAHAAGQDVGRAAEPTAPDGRLGRLAQQAAGTPARMRHARTRTRMLTRAGAVRRGSARSCGRGSKSRRERCTHTRARAHCKKMYRLLAVLEIAMKAEAETKHFMAFWNVATRYNVKKRHRPI